MIFVSEPGLTPRLASLLARLRAGKNLLASDLRLRLPAPPQNRRLGTLGLDARTFNALRRARFGRNPTSIGHLTVAEALELRGFGRRCLEVILLASRRWNQSTDSASDTTSHQRITQRIIAEADTLDLRKHLHEHLPDLPTGVSVESLEISMRVRNCLTRLGVISGTNQLSSFTIGALLRTSAFGRTSLLNLSTALELAHERGHGGSESIARDSFSRHDVELLADRMQIAIGEQIIYAKDPRFGRLLRNLRSGSSAALVTELRKGASSHEWLIAAEALVTQLERSHELTLEAEALSVRRIRPVSRDEAIVRAYFGFGDRTPCTLARAGVEFGLTRERIRQICGPKRVHVPGGTAFMPVLRTVLHQIEAACPTNSARLEQELVSADRVEPDTNIGEILRYAEVAGLRPNVAEHDIDGVRVVALRAHGTAIRRVMSRLAVLTDISGAVTQARLADALLGYCDKSDAVRLVQAMISGVESYCTTSHEPCWILRSSSAGSRFIAGASQIVRTAGRIKLAQVRRALRREYRNGVFVPSSDVLREVIRRCTELTINAEDDLEVNQTSPQPMPLWDGEQMRLTEVLAREGGVLDRERLQELAAEAGITTSNFWRILNYSPLIDRLDRGVYGIVGMQRSPSEIAEIQRLLSQKRVAGGYADRGWTPDGRFFLGYRISSAMIETGIAGVPRTVRLNLPESVRLTETQEPMALTLSDTAMWGFRKHLLECGAEAGDYVAFIFTPVAGTAEIRVGDESLLDQIMDADAVANA